MLLTLTLPDADSFWAQPDVTIVQYVIMLIVAATGFASNFQKKSASKYGLLAISIIALITYCYMGYMRQSAESIFAVFPLLAVLITPILGSYLDHHYARSGLIAAHWLSPHLRLCSSHVQG